MEWSPWRVGNGLEDRNGLVDRCGLKDRFGLEDQNAGQQIRMRASESGNAGHRVGGVFSDGAVT